MGHDQRIRVLWAIKQLGPGGSERLLASAAGCHDHDRFAIEAVYLLRRNDELVPTLERNGVRVHCLDVDGALDARWVPRLRSVIAEGDYDILHVHSPLLSGIAPVLLATIPLTSRPALVITEHGAWHHYQLPTRLLNVASRPFGDAHLAVSESARASLPWWLRRRTEVLIHGTEVAALSRLAADRAAVRRELCVADDEILVLTVANLRREKDYPSLLAAAALVVEAVPAVRFAAAGGGHLAEELWAEQRRLGLGARFQFLGFRVDAVRLMAGADIFVLPSQEEGSPVAVAEAMAMGLPIIATRVGGVPRAVRDGIDGLIVPPGRPDRLADAICRLASDPTLRRELGASARRRSEEFDIGRTVAAIEGIYTRLAGQRRARSRTLIEAL